MDAQVDVAVEQWSDENWQLLQSWLPDGWQEAARQRGALLLRRQVKDAESLLRMVLAYAVGKSLRQVAAWAEQAGLVSTISNPAILKRLKAAAQWQEWIVQQKLSQRREHTQPRPRAQPKEHTELTEHTQQPQSLDELAMGRRVRLVDATGISRPGSTGTDWRIHTSYNLATQQLDGVMVTDASVGESLCWVECSPGDILIADRAYPCRSGIDAVVRQGADVIVRMTWQNLPLLHPQRAEPAQGSAEARTMPEAQTMSAGGDMAFDLFAHLHTLQPDEIGDWAVRTKPNVREQIPEIVGRVVAIRKSEEAAVKARAALLKEAHRKGKEPSPQSLDAAGYTFVFTTLSQEQFAGKKVLKLYRYRWQVEMVYKRSKSILQLGEMAAKCDPLCRTFLWGKVLLVLLAEDLCSRYGAFSPGAGATVPAGKPVAAV